MGVDPNEAKEKWCPMARIFRTPNPTDPAPANRAVSYNRVIFPEDPDRVRNVAKCIAEDCMFWRWLESFKKGYCGIAGKPAPG